MDAGAVTGLVLLAFGAITGLVLIGLVIAWLNDED